MEKNIKKDKRGVSIAFYLPEETVNKLKRYCKVTNTTQSKFIRDLIDTKIDNMQNLFGEIDREFTDDGKFLLLDTINHLNNTQIEILNLLKK